jgi:tRNA(adenine34) deaminase
MDLATAEAWMREAISEARKAEEEEEVPVGAILLLNDKIIGRGHNSPIHRHDPTAHAEILALRQGAHNCQNYRLPGSVLIVTIEPCIMCVGTMIHARVEEVIYGAADPKTGAAKSRFQLADSSLLNHRLRITPGVLENDCGLLLKSFFASRR